MCTGRAKPLLGLCREISLLGYATEPNYETLRQMFTELYRDSKPAGCNGISLPRVSQKPRLIEPKKDGRPWQKMVSKTARCQKLSKSKFINSLKIEVGPKKLMQFEESKYLK